LFEQSWRRISAAASGDRAFDHVTAISRYHRIQASPGFRQAAGYCLDHLLGSSPDAGLVYYPAERDVRFWGHPSFEEWSCKSASLTVTSPEHLAGKIADFQDCPISLIQRSCPTPRRGIEAELVFVGDGRSAGDYGDARGKIGLSDSVCPRCIYRAATEGGAIGVVLYRQRPLPPLRVGSGVRGVRQYSSFWAGETGLFGFVLTPETGESIARHLRGPQARSKPVKVHAQVDSESRPGTFEVVTSLIPGKEQREVVLVAHLCHPKPSAGDNASGAAALLEAHRILTELIEKRSLPRPRYGIRFLLVPEITGTMALISREPAVRRRLIMGLNLDMVGQDQDITGATMCVESTPKASPSFGNYLLGEVTRRAFTSGRTPGAAGELLGIRMQQTAFSGGSDHMILSDPTVGVPTPMLIQWPDKYYHTSGDTPDKVSPEMLGSVVAAAATHIYTCALASEEDMLWISGITGRALRRQVAAEMGAFAGSDARAWIDYAHKSRFLRTHGRRTLRSISRLVPESRRLRKAVDAEISLLARCIRQEVTAARRVENNSQEGRPKPRVFTSSLERVMVRRLVPGPPDMPAALRDAGLRRRRQYEKLARQEPMAGTIASIALYWADGRRSVAGIARQVAAEIGHTNPGFLKAYFDVLREAGVVEFTRS
jgi:hypothetical protein